MTKHTPGPWHVYGDDKTLIGAADGKMMLAKTNHRHICQEWSRPVEEAQANARLIAAAPELLVALKNLSAEMMFSTGREQVFVEEARAAIAKARGDG